MSWWEGPLDRLRGRFATGGMPSAEQRPAPNVAGPSAPPDAWSPDARSPDAWSDVPPLQRTLGDPILPVAINHRFRDSLASFTDPSFLTPLSHQVDPSVGGLVDGLVSRGEPHTHGGPDLVLPSPGAGQAKPQVQRLASWTSSADDLQTVPLQYREPVSGKSPLVPAGGNAATVDDPPTPAVPSVRTPMPISPMPISPVLNNPVLNSPVQRAAASVDNQPATAEPATPVAVPKAPALPAVAPDNPTLGAGSVPALPSGLDEPLAAVGSAPREPAVQRIRYEPVESWHRSEHGPRHNRATGSDPTVEPAVQRAPQPQRATVPQLPERPSGSQPALDPQPLTRGSQTSTDTSSGAAARGPRSSEVPPALDPAGFEGALDSPQPQVSRLADSVQLLAAEEPGFIEAPLVVTWNQNAPTAAVGEPSPSGWASAGHTTARLDEAAPGTTGGFGPATRMAAPIVAVQRRVADPVPSSAGSGLPVQTEHAAVPAILFPQPPLVVARSAVTQPRQDAFTPVAQGMSFARMFSDAPSGTTTDAADERASLQREAVEAATAAMPSVQTDPGETAAPVATTAAGPVGAEGAAGPAGNLDEMARRLYEPLAARLREELWLDRERAGLMNDV